MAGEERFLIWQAPPPPHGEQPPPPETKPYRVTWKPGDCHVIGMWSSRDWHVCAMRLPCDCYAITMAPTSTSSESLRSDAVEWKAAIAPLHAGHHAA